MVSQADPTARSTSKNYSGECAHKLRQQHCGDPEGTNYALLLRTCNLGIAVLGVDVAVVVVGEVVLGVDIVPVGVDIMVLFAEIISSR